MVEEMILDVDIAVRVCNLVNNIGKQDDEKMDRKSYEGAII